MHPVTHASARLFRQLWLSGALVATALCSLPGAAQSGAGEFMPICAIAKCLNPQAVSKSGIGTANAMVEAKVLQEEAEKWCATFKPRDKYCPNEQVKNGGTGGRSFYRASADCLAGRMTPIDGNTYVYAGLWDEGPGKGRPRFATNNPRFPSKKWEEIGADIAPGTKDEIIGWGGGSPNLAAQWEVLCAGAPAPAMK